LVEPDRTLECFLFEWDGAIVRRPYQSAGWVSAARELFPADNTSPLDYVPVKQFQMARFDGGHLTPFSPAVSGSAAGH
jgi:hypothetical protein